MCTLCCVDVNECESILTNNCEHKCRDTITSFVCECDPGYKLQTDKKSCEGKVNNTHLLCICPLKYYFLLHPQISVCVCIWQTLMSVQRCLGPAVRPALTPLATTPVNVRMASRKKSMADPAKKLTVSTEGIPKSGFMNCCLNFCLR